MPPLPERNLCSAGKDLKEFPCGESKLFKGVDITCSYNLLTVSSYFFIAYFQCCEKTKFLLSGGLKDIESLNKKN